MLSPSLPHTLSVFLDFSLSGFPSLLLLLPFSVHAHLYAAFSLSSPSVSVFTDCPPSPFKCASFYLHLLEPNIPHCSHIKLQQGIRTKQTLERRATVCSLLFRSTLFCSVLFRFALSVGTCQKCNNYMHTKTHTHWHTRTHSWPAFLTCCKLNSNLHTPRYDSHTHTHTYSRTAIAWLELNYFLCQLHTIKCNGIKKQTV